MNKKILWLVIVVVVIIIAWLGLSKNKAVITTEAVKIGSIMPLTGDFAFFGGEILKGEQIAIDEAKQEGWNVELISEDDQSKPTGSVNSANKLVRVDKVSVVLTAILQEVKPMTGIFAEGTTPLLATWDSNEYIKTAGKNIFSIGFSTESAGHKMAEYAYNKLKLRNVAVIGAQDEWSNIISTSFVNKFTSLGGKIVMNEQVLPNLKEFRTQIAKVKNLKADGLYAPLFPTTIAPLLKQMKELELETTFMTADSFSIDELEASNGTSEGIYFSNLYADDIKSLETKYLKKYGKESGASVFVSFGYNGVKTALEAIRISKSKNISVSEAMRQVDIAGTDSRIKMDGKQYSEKLERLYQVRGKEFVEVK